MKFKIWGPKEKIEPSFALRLEECPAIAGDINLRLGDINLRLIDESGCPSPVVLYFRSSSNDLKICRNALRALGIEVRIDHALSKLP